MWSIDRCIDGCFLSSEIKKDEVSVTSHNKQRKVGSMKNGFIVNGKCFFLYIYKIYTVK